MRLRPATRDDAARLAALINVAYRVEDFFKTGDRTDPEDVRDRMAAGTFLLLEDDGGGLAGAVYVKAKGARGYFGMLSIDPARQKQGLGAQLIGAAEAHCREAGCTEMELDVVSLRTELPPFYRRFGYAESGTRPFTDPSKIPCHFVVMTKAL